MSCRARSRSITPSCWLTRTSTRRRGTAFDIFGYSADRRLERDLIAGYEKDVATVLGLLSPLTLDTAIELLSLPDRIRGYGPVKEKAVQDAKARYAQLAADLAT